MTDRKIRKLIKEKGEPTNEVFNSLNFTLSYILAEEYDKSFISTLTYNSTILFINEILNNKPYYAPMFEISQTELETLQNDYDNMEFIDYPIKYWYLNTDGIEIEIIKIFERKRIRKMKESNTDIKTDINI